MAKTYLWETTVAAWSSLEIRRFFENANYSVLDFAMSQQAEKRIPADYIYKVQFPVKIFGLQYKALYGSRGHDHWRLKREQHRRLSRTRWISYALSELKENRDHLNALHALRLREATFPFTPDLHVQNRGPVRRWWTFYELLKSCPLGLYVTAAAQLEQALIESGITDYTEDDLRHLDVLVMSLAVRQPRVIRMSELSSNLTQT